MIGPGAPIAAYCVICEMEYDLYLQQENACIV